MRIKKSVYLLLSTIIFTGCTSNPEDQHKYEKALSKAKEVIKSNKAINAFETYYDAPNNKAFAQSKVSGIATYAINRSSEKVAIDDALHRCNYLLIKVAKYKKITNDISCEIVNVNDEWKK